jgi:hypothetical protein
MSFVPGQYFISRISCSLKEKTLCITTPEVVLLEQKGGNPQNWKCRAKTGNFFINNSFSVTRLFSPGTYDFKKVKTNFTSSPYL